MNVLQFKAPPLPHYITSGFVSDFPAGSKHVGRQNVGVFDLLVVTKGCLYLREEDRSYEVGEGCTLILRPDQAHYPTRPCTETTQHYWLHFQTTGEWSVSDALLPSGGPVSEEEQSSPAWSLEARPFHLQLPQFSRLQKPDSAHSLLARLVALNVSAHLDGARWKQEALFQELLQQLAAEAPGTGPSPGVICARQAAAYLREHYREDVTVQAMGGSLNFHPIYIARCMQAEYGCSPVEYLLRYRMEQAKLLLLQTDYPVTRIAEEVGFNQAAYFTARFTKYEGLSPRRYRQRFAHT
ncbi:AraC family transcriptional regulator [Paenibacillus swuensis]|uniref:AraC family transcriptional regulator n=1 Tax=Paenibacillus swuensis TaxID=1178515 RepID=A0A172TF59_9BACL|nr:AraC family transcriptional regulator [Paenibacillus swuensis]ANE45705.1 AraC family transcriptional regulator [Paenibacillus swuensis]